MKQNTGVERQNISVCLFWQPRFCCCFYQLAYDKLGRREITLQLHCSLGFLCFLLLIWSLCMALLSIVSSRHPHGSSGKELGTVNFSAAWKNEQHQSQGNVLISYLERCCFNICDNVIFFLNAVKIYNVSATLAPTVSLPMVIRYCFVFLPTFD